jgi:hypothetical protein
VDKCQALKEISLSVCPRLNEILMETSTPIIINNTIDLSRIVARPDICKLNGKGLLIENDNYLLYLMHKYPQLELCSININNRFFGEFNAMGKNILSTRNNFTLPITVQFLFYFI